MKAQVTLEDLIRSSCNEAMSDRDLGRVSLKKIATLFFSQHQHLVLEQVDSFIQKKKPIDETMRSVASLAKLANLDYEVLWEKLQQHTNFWKATKSAYLEDYLKNLKTETFESYIQTLHTNQPQHLSLLLASSSWIKSKLTEYKYLKNNQHFVPMLVPYYLRELKDPAEYNLPTFLPQAASVANFSPKLAESFEAKYVHYLENGKQNYEWEKRVYISTLCRALRAYKSREFRALLIKKLVVIKIPSLQKRLSREFARSRRYLNMAE